MSDDKNTSAKALDFKDFQQDDVHSGALKFSTDYISRQQLFLAVRDWVNSDERVKHAVIRGGGKNQLAVDFIFDSSDLSEEDRGGNTLEKVFKPFFNEYLGGDYMIGWDYANGAVILKQ